ncbi:MAG: 16S rRNA (uracil(1498)-N(3))-methyltransferase [Caldicoprobacterales bacterium]|jgi:16S rRNA (uracil1498-N3)-methyltransferase|nr:16S rRNA (uracil(1498)-N(3))-methyltransferase [Clostridiales bacterium]
MHRFFIEPEDIEGNIGRIKGSDAHHLNKVLRLNPGDEIMLCNGRGLDFRSVIQTVEKEEILVEILDSRPNATEPNVRVSLFQGIPKSSKMELIIQKCVELGIYELIPIQTLRCVAKINEGKDSEKKTLRWQRIAEEAAKQSRRGIIPMVSSPISFNQAVMYSKADVKLIFWEEENTKSLRKILEELNFKPETVAMIIGPEGGLEKSEVELAEKHGWISVSLGSRILRTETAGMAALTAIMYHLEELE